MSSAFVDENCSVHMTSSHRDSSSFIHFSIMSIVVPPMLILDRAPGHPLTTPHTDATTGTPLAGTMMRHLTVMLLNLHFYHTSLPRSRWLHECVNADPRCLPVAACTLTRWLPLLSSLPSLVTHTVLPLLTSIHPFLTWQGWVVWVSQSSRQASHWRHSPRIRSILQLRGNFLTITSTDVIAVTVTVTVCVPVLSLPLNVWWAWCDIDWQLCIHPPHGTYFLLILMTSE
jgi:hypothetical protein